MQTALQIAWISGEASRQGITFTDTEVQQSLQQIKSQFKTQAEYVKARDQAGLTDADVLERAKLQLIQNKLQSKVQDSVGDVSDERCAQVLRRQQEPVHSAGEAHDPDRPEPGRPPDQPGLPGAPHRRFRRQLEEGRGAVLHGPDLEGQGRAADRRRARLVPAAARRRHLQGAVALDPGAGRHAHGELRLRGGIGHAREGHGLRRDLRIDRPAAPAASSATRSSSRSRASSSRRRSAPSASTSATTGPT